jgi:glycosyltransferase involved in cell wall biosynthesis
MRICLLADAQSIHTRRWLAFFAGRGHEVHVVSFRPATSSAGHIYAYNWGKRLGKLRYLLYMGRIRRLVRRLRPQIVHAHHATSYGLAGALTDCHPFLIHTWGRDVLDFPQRSRLYRRLLRFNLGRADVITTTSRVMAEAAEALMRPGTPVHVIPFGADLHLFRPRPTPKPPGAPVVIGTVKALEKLYGVDHLLRAFADVPRRGFDLRLTIVGDGSQRMALETLAQELGIEGLVRFMGRVPHQELPAYLQQMDVFVMPSLQESFGVAAVEAAAVGLPIVASDVGGLPEVVVQGETGFLVPPADVDALTGRLAQLISDSTLRCRMGEAGRAYAITQYDWRANAAQMERLYQSLIVN